MDNLKIVGAPLPDMPWEDRPEGSKEVLWRYSKNPVIPPDIEQCVQQCCCPFQRWLCRCVPMRRYESPDAFARRF